MRFLIRPVAWFLTPVFCGVFVYFLHPYFGGWTLVLMPLACILMLWLDRGPRTLKEDVTDPEEDNRIENQSDDMWKYDTDLAYRDLPSNIHHWETDSRTGLPSEDGLMR